MSLLVLAGCAQRAYDGPVLPSSELSRLQRQLGGGDGGVNTQSCWFVSVGEWPIGRYHNVDVLPGLQEIIFEVSWTGGFVEQIPLSLRTTAGRRYQFHAQTHDPDWGLANELLGRALIPVMPLLVAIEELKRATHRPLDLDTAVWVTELESDIVVWGYEPVWAWGRTDW